MIFDNASNIGSEGQNFIVKLSLEIGGSGSFCSLWATLKLKYRNMG